MGAYSHMGAYTREAPLHAGEVGAIHGVLILYGCRVYGMNKVPYSRKGLIGLEISLADQQVQCQIVFCQFFCVELCPTKLHMICARAQPSTSSYYNLRRDLSYDATLIVLAVSA